MAAFFSQTGSWTKCKRVFERVVKRWDILCAGSTVEGHAYVSTLRKLGITTRAELNALADEMYTAAPTERRNRGIKTKSANILVAAAFFCNHMDELVDWVDYAAGKQEEYKEDHEEDESDDMYEYFAIFEGNSMSPCFGFDADAVDAAIDALIDERDGAHLTEALAEVGAIEI